MAAKKSANGKTEVAIDRVRAFWAERQGMSLGMKKASANEVLARTGWARSVGGCNPYLILRDRAGIGREAADRAAKELLVQELPAARGCTYVVPREDFAIALRASHGHSDDAEMVTAKKHLGVTDKEIDRLCQRVIDAVAKEPLDPAGIKESVGDAVRSLGADGKKRGVGTTLPLALGILQTRGLVRRVSVDGRFDQQRFRYAAWDPSPLAKSASKTLTGDAIAIELASRFFRWSGPATVAQLAWWAGLGVKAARAAAAEMKVVPLAEGDERLIFADDRDALLAMEIPREPRVSFVSGLDNVLHMRRDVAAHTEDPEVLASLPGAKAAGPSLAELPVNPILDRGRLIGVWEWDGLESELVWRTFAKAGSQVKEAAKEAADAFAAYVKKDLVDARSFSLDSPESRGKRVDALRKMRA